MGGSLKNISLRLFRQFLISKGLKIIRTNGGHEIWGGKQLLRPIVFQTHIDPIPEFVIKNNLRNMGITVEEFLEFCEK
jgi:hypothetical protein